MSRMHFIPELQEKIAIALQENHGVSRYTFDHVMELWERDGTPKTPIERAVFGVLEQVQKDIEGA